MKIDVFILFLLSEELAGDEEIPNTAIESFKREIHLVNPKRKYGYTRCYYGLVEY